MRYDLEDKSEYEGNIYSTLQDNVIKQIAYTMFGGTHNEIVSTH